jgi:hypothetical protein
MSLHVPLLLSLLYSECVRASMVEICLKLGDLVADVAWVPRTLGEKEHGPA